VVRDYAPDDLGDCLDVFDTNMPRFFAPDERELFESFLYALPGPYSVLADSSGRVVACGGYALEDGGRRADLCWGMVCQELHGRGLGRQLTEARMQRIGEEPSVREIALNTSQFTSAFYERMGFQLMSVDRDGYAPGLDRCEMRLFVDGPTGTSGQ